MRKGTKAQSKPPKPVERLLRTIRQVRSARHSQKLEELSESELLIYMADILSDDPHERRLIACALAANFARGPDDNNVDKACELLEDTGVSGFEPEGLIAMRASPVFHEFQQVERDYPPNGFDYDRDYEQIAERFERIRALAIAAGSIAVQTQATRW